MTWMIVAIVVVEPQNSIVSCGAGHGAETNGKYPKHNHVR